MSSRSITALVRRSPTPCARSREKSWRGRLTFDEIDTEAISERLDTAGIPYPDLMIPTSGEQCLSNFLLRQAAYSEFVFLPINWPDFDRAAFEAAVAEYAHRDRRFGCIEEPGRKAKIAS